MSLKEKLGLLSATILTVGFGAAAPAQAQQTPATPAASAEEEAIVVTGSRIRRDPANAPAPLIQVTNDDIMRSGSANVIDFLADIPALQNSTVPEDTTGLGLNDGGLSLLNLRNLGSARTLVLIDGRRHVGAQQGALAMDFDSVPRLLIENIEIITGGQSALYGADAVAGVVNVIMKKDFEGLMLDVGYNQINQDGQSNQRVSALIGHNFFDDRLNIYLNAEYVNQEEVQDADVDWRADAWTLLNYDTDTTAAPSDGNFDNILIRGARSLQLGPRGGIVVLAGQTVPSPATDPDIPGLGTADSPAASCAAPTAAQLLFTSNISGAANCYPIGPELAGRFYIFDSNGVARLPSFGTFQDQNGNSRPTNIGGDGLNTGTDFSNVSRIPQSEEYRYQVGLNFDITDDIQFFMEGKFTHEETYDDTQPTFFQGGIGTPVAGQIPTIFSTSNFNIGNDNAFLDPAVRAAILANTRRTSSTNAALIADPRATFNLFGRGRPQFNTREVTRYVAGFRSDLDSLLFLNNAHWELGYTYGQTDNDNAESAVDVVRFAMSLDAVRDTANVLGGGVNSIVCRARLMNATAPGSVPNQALGPNGGAGTVFFAANDPAVTGCVAQSPFGVDMRTPGYNPAAEAYYNATIHVSHTNRQQDLMGFVSGDLWDFWGAGPIGLAVGYEWRREKAVGIGRSRDTGNRVLFLNTGLDFPASHYNTTEYFGEISVPLIRDSWLGESAEAGFAYRSSDYSTVGQVESRSFQVNWRPVHELLLRATYGESIRVPTLSENFNPATQTFANAFIDPCDVTQINNAILADPVRGNQRAANCVSLGIPSGTPIIYTSGRPGINSGNPFLLPETSTSYTWSIVYTPSWLDDASFVVDYYDIHLINAIASVTAQQAANLCVNSGAGLNSGACAVIFRAGAAGDTTTSTPAYGVNFFIQGQLNYAGSTARGMDFAARYHLDLEDKFSLNWGELDFMLRGNYLIKRDDFASLANPGLETPIDSTVENPRVRFLLSTTYSPTPDWRFIWDWDWQASQEILDDRAFLVDTDNRDPRFANTGDFSQHDFTLRWDASDNINFRVGVVNAFDAEPARWLGSQTSADNFDLYGRRFFIGAQFRH